MKFTTNIKDLTLSKSKTLNIVTHDGTFHADEVMAIAWLSFLQEIDNINILVLRTRDIKNIKNALLVDVGNGEFDHHTTLKPRSDSSIPYASFGLIFKKYYKKVFNLFKIPEFNNKYYKKVEKELVIPIDAIDNGIAQYETTSPTPLYKSLDVSQLIFNFNNEENNIKNFELAVNFAISIIQNYLNKLAQEISDYKLVGKAFYDNTRPTQYLILNKSCHWQEALTELDNKGEILYIIYPETEIKNGWRTITVPTYENKFLPKKPLPKSWAGKRDEEFQTLTGVKDAIFCHPACFICGAQSKEGVIKLAELALKN